MFVAGTLLGAWALAATLACAYALSARWLQEADTRVRVLGTIAVFFAGQALAFYALIAMRWFSVGALIAITVAATAAAIRAFRKTPALLTTARHDVGNLVSGLSLFRRMPVLLGTAPIAALVAWHGLRALVIPPIDWDSILYQLVRPALWIQSHGFYDYEVPGWWRSAYHVRLPAGNSWSAWMMLPVHGDAYVGAGWVAIWGVFLGATYVVARMLGISKVKAWFASLAALLSPAMAAQMVTAYVDNLVGLLIVVGTGLFVDMEKNERVGSGYVAILAFATATAAKKTGAPFLLVASLIFLVIRLRQRNRRLLRDTAVVAAIGLSLLGPPVAAIWAETGSPIYPYGLTIGETEIFPRAAKADGLSNTIKPPSLDGKLRLAFFQGYSGRWKRHTNYGLGAIPLFAGGLIGLVSIMRRRQGPRIAVGGVTLASVLAIGLVIYHPTGSGLCVGRYAAGSAALLAMLVGASSSRLSWPLLGAGLAMNVAYLWPVNVGTSDFAATVVLLLALCPFAAVIVALVLKSRGQPRSRALSMRLGAVVVGIVALGATVDPVRDVYRHDIYREASLGQSYANFPVGGVNGEAFASAEVFEAVDQPDEPHTVAVTVGWDGRGINWFVLPIMGRNLQNHLVYVPVTESGEIVDLEHRPTTPLSYQRWLERLRERGVDVVASLAPLTLEARWMAAHPEAFEVVAQGPHPHSVLFRLRPPAAQDAESASK